LRTPCAIQPIDDAHAHVAARPVKRSRLNGLDERILSALLLDGALVDAFELVQDVAAEFEDGDPRLVWHALAIYRRALIDLELAAAPRNPPPSDVVLAASLSLAQRLVCGRDSPLANLDDLACAFGSALGEPRLCRQAIAKCSWRIVFARGFDFACASSCPFDVAADVLLAHFGSSAQRCLVPPYQRLEPNVADRLRDAGDHLLAVASSSRIASEDHAVLGAAAAICALRARDGPLTPAMLDCLLKRLALSERRAAVLAAALQMRSEHLVRSTLHTLSADLRERIYLAHASSRCVLREPTASFVTW
jgi:hypothetical protein